jgi:hypothetical protein
MDSDSNEDKRICTWCGEEIQRVALKCPRCLLWRKDIHIERILAYCWGMGSILPVILFALNARNAASYVHYGMFLDYIGTKAGLSILIIFAIMFSICIFYWVRVSKKIGTFYWF